MQGALVKVDECRVHLPAGSCAATADAISGGLASSSTALQNKGIPSVGMSSQQPATACSILGEIPEGRASVSLPTADIGHSRVLAMVAEDQQVQAQGIMHERTGDIEMGTVGRREPACQPPATSEAPCLVEQVRMLQRGAMSLQV